MLKLVIQNGCAVRLCQVPANGAVELVTSDPVIMRRALAAHITDTVASFVFFDGEDEDRIEGKVVSAQPTVTPFRFTVLAHDQ